MPRPSLRTYLVFTGSGPILVASSFPKLTDARLVERLRHKGIERFLAYEVDLDAVESQYGESFASAEEDLMGTEDLRVIDFNGHQIMARFSLEALGDPIRFGG